jgi:hypothetical protein
MESLEVEYHLTPRGWVGGTVRGGWGAQHAPSPPPADRLLTLTHTISQPSAYEPEERTVQVTWRGSASDEEITALRLKYPPPFDPGAE